MWKRSLLALSLCVACGPTVGDPCTTGADCLNQQCFQQDWAPGGYCSTSCRVDDINSCPVGTVCVRGLLANNAGGCMRSCRTASDCRAGYVCQSERSSLTAVCVGARGL